jgi:replication fork clamp-binding protein CrfC
LDYSRQQDQIAQQDTLVWENDSLFNEVQDSILNADEQRLIEDVTEYLDRIAQKGLEKERTIDSLRRENRESKELRELLRDPEIPDLP